MWYMDSSTRNGQRVSAFKIGDTIDFKIKAGRGRPSKGIIIQKKDRSLLVQTPRSERIDVPIDKVLGKHVTRYSERQRRLL